MTDTQEFSGKTIEEALQSAADALGADPGSLEYDVVEAPKRFFFMSGPREYRIRVSAVRESVSTTAAPATTAPRDPEPAEVPATAATATTHAAAPAAPVATASVEDDTAPLETDEELDRIQDVIERFIELWGLDLDAEVISTPERVEVHLSGPDEDWLVEKKGAVLLSLQLVLGKMLYRQGLIHRKLQVDCGGYRLRREEELQQIAINVGQKVKRLGEDCYLNPLNPYERRIVHLALVDDDEVTTISEGDGYMKRIRVTAR